MAKQIVSLCWTCKNACGNCSWSKSFAPVDGWIAKSTVIKCNFIHKNSYLVEKCPLYKKDSYQTKKMQAQAIATKNGISLRKAYKSLQKDKEK